MRRSGFRRTASAAVIATLLAAGLHAAPGGAGVVDAARAGDVAAVRALLKQGGDVNAAQGDGMTALHWAAQQGNAELVSMLLSAGANVRATTRLGDYTPLHLASQAGHATTVAALIAAGAAADVRTTTGASPLMLAAKSGSTDTVTRLIENGSDINAAETANGQTALMVAAGLNRPEVVEAAAGAWRRRQAGVEGRRSQRAHRGCRSRSGAGRSLRAGPQPIASAGEVAGLTRPYRYNELIGSQGGLTALHFAARQGAAQSVAALVDGGVAVNLPSPGDKATPLLVAIINGHFDIAAYLLEHGADPNLVSDAGVSPLYATLNVQWAPIAAYPQPRAHLQQGRTYLEMMNLLIQKGADPNARVKRKVWYSSYNFDQSSVDEIGATAVLARGVCRRHRRDEDAGRRRRRPEHRDDEADVPALRRRGRRTRRRGSQRSASGAGRRPECDAAAGRGGRRLWLRLRRQLAPLRRDRHAAGGEVSGRGSRRRRERRGRRRQHRRASRRRARRQRDDSATSSPRAPTSSASTAPARPPWTWPTARCSARSPTPRPSRCSRSSAR